MSSAFKINTHYLADETCSWSNLGYWLTDVSLNHFEKQAQSKTSYPAACERLATWVAQNSEVSYDQKILDLCVGEGGSVRFWIDKYNAKVVDAVELRCGALTELINKPPQRLRQILCSNVENPRLFSLITPNSYDHVLCIDALYHLSDPKNLWKLANHALITNGSLGFCTLLRSGNRAPSRTVRQLLKLARIDVEHIPDTTILQNQLQDFGFGPLRIVWGTEPVLRGFVNFVRLRAKQLSLPSRFHFDWLKIAATAKLAEAILNDKELGYACVAVKKYNF